MAEPLRKSVPLFGGDFVIGMSDGCVTMWHKRPLQTHEELDTLLITLDGMLARAPYRALLIDTTGCAERSPEDVGKRMMEWCKNAEVVERVAMLVSDEMQRVMATMRGVSEASRRFRGFTESREAMAWLTARPSAARPVGG